MTKAYRLQNWGLIWVRDFQKINYPKIRMIIISECRFRPQYFASNMTWKGKHPVVKLVIKTYETGVKLTKKVMFEIEKQVLRLTNSGHELFDDLGNWFVDICFGKT